MVRKDVSGKNESWTMNHGPSELKSNSRNQFEIHFINNIWKQNIVQSLDSNVQL